jgi:diacylglycerol kinase family enzyme
VRALLIVNPRATSTTRLRRDVIASALASAVELEVVETRYRGHATKLAAAARSEGYGLVLTLGGDGTVNEAVNGILGCASHPPAGPAPALGALPGGSANVFTGSLGMGRDPVDAAGQILQALAEHRERIIGLGLADGRYFTFNSGLGLDAEVVRAVQGLRAHGRTVTPALYVRLTLRQFYRQSDRRQPKLTIEVDDHPAAEPVFLGIVSNTAPWTYLGNRAVHASPRAGFDTGLDVFALRSMSSVGTFYAVGQMLRAAGTPPHGRNILAFHDQPRVTFRSDRPVALQIDGEYVGEREIVTFHSIPRALRVIV